MSRLAALRPRYDLLIIGGGISGAGLLREAARAGVSALLVERGDFASGTSSWSSKLVHGGLRYLKQGHWRLTLESVRERERLLREVPDLVQPQAFLMPVYQGRSPGRATLQLGLWLYDRMAGGARRSRWLSAAAAQREAAAPLRAEGLLGAMAYHDARTDDARLVWRLIEQARREGATALNYVGAQALLKQQGRIAGAALEDRLEGQTREIEAAVVIHATGVWADQLPGTPPGAPRIRPLRGSHLLLPVSRLPLAAAVSWLHPRDRRPVFAYPWLGAVLYGTTDLDHPGDRDRVRLQPEELDYLLEGLAQAFPAARIEARDVIATTAGLRPVIDDGRGGDPSSASRESAIWEAPGYVGVTGGKLTTFRPMAREVLARAARQLPGLRLAPATAPVLPAADPEPAGEPIAGTPWNWAQLLARAEESVIGPADLLLRRTRLGLVLPGGARELLPELARRLGHRPGWQPAQLEAYQQHWQREYGPGADQ